MTMPEQCIFFRGGGLMSMLAAPTTRMREAWTPAVI